jgi:hypothetical protein
LNSESDRRMPIQTLVVLGSSLYHPLVTSLA